MVQTPWCKPACDTLAQHSAIAAQGFRRATRDVRLLRLAHMEGGAHGEHCHTQAANLETNNMCVAAGVLVAGGGPAGYATAIALAKRGFRDIVVLERGPSASFFDATRSIVFVLTPPAKQALRDLGLSNIDHAGARRPPLGCAACVVRTSEHCL